MHFPWFWLDSSWRHAFPSRHNITVSLSLLYTASFYLCLNLIYLLHKWPQRKLYSCTHCCSYKSQNKKNTYNWWFCSIFLYDGWWVPFISGCTNAEFIRDVVRLLNFDLRRPHTFEFDDWIFGKVVLSVGAALRKSFFCPRLILSMS